VALVSITKAIAKLLRVRWLLMRFGFEECLKKLQLRAEMSPQSVPDISAETIALWRRRATYLRKSSKLIIGSYCLARSLALCHWARAEGVSIRLVIGAKRHESKTNLHAWCVLHGQVLDSDATEISQFKILFEC
jgi:hypothetical protein